MRANHDPAHSRARWGSLCLLRGGGDLSADHLLARSIGGLTVPTNLVAACTPCNNGRGATPPRAMAGQPPERQQAPYHCCLPRDRRDHRPPGAHGGHFYPRGTGFGRLHEHPRGQSLVASVSRPESGAVGADHPHGPRVDPLRRGGGPPSRGRGDPPDVRQRLIPPEFSLCTEFWDRKLILGRIRPF